MRKIENLDELHRVELGIMDAIHDFCVAHDIKYSLSSGTLLGAVRHKGFIPWDDDMDIYMLRDEYERFVESFNGAYPHYEVLTPKNSDSFFSPFAKVQDKRTRLHDVFNKTCELGVNVDIFPIDGISDDENERRRVFSKVRRLRWMLRAKNVKFTSKRPLVNNLCYSVIKVLLLAVPKKSIIRKIEEESVRGGSDTTLVYNFAGGTDNVKSCFPRKCLEEYDDMIFEDRKYKVMKDHDAYLTHTYGDYMTPPPESKRRVSHLFETYRLDE